MEQLQRTPEWFQQRLYKYTSSEIYKLFTDPKSKAAKDAGELSETTKDYILKKIAEELGASDPEFSTKATAWGEENEPNAKMWYEIKTGRKVGEVGFCQYDEFFGGSPDAAVWDASLSEAGEHGLVNVGLEIKCPYNPFNHLKHCLIDSAEYFKAKHPNYYWQCISHMVVLNVEYCDFVSFDPRIDHEMGLFIFRVEQNETDIRLLHEKLETAKNYRNEMKIKLGLL